MSATQPEIRRWSTDPLPPSHRLDYWVGAICEGFLEMTAGSPHQGDFHATLESADCGPIAVNRVRASGIDVWRTREAISRSGAHHYYLIGTRDAEWSVTQRDARVWLRPRDMVLVDSEQRYKLSFPVTAETVSIQLPASWLAAWLPDPQLAIARSLDGQSGWGAVLSGFMHQMSPEAVVNAPLAAHVIADQFGALLALASGVQAPGVALRTRDWRLPVWPRVGSGAATPSFSPDVDQPMAPAAAETIRFGPFCLTPADRTLRENGQPVHLGSRAIEMLMLLVERAGQFVRNDEIFERVWPRTVVVEGNLRVHMAALRKALHDGRDGRRYIVNVPNGGYSFVQRVVRTRTERPAVPAMAAARGGLPASLTRIIGQDQTVQALSEQLRHHRLVTLVGAGGVGKTVIGLAAAALALQAPQPPWERLQIVDLASLTQETLVPCVLAQALGHAAGPGNPVSDLPEVVRDRRLLIVLDTCEHLVAAVASLVETILRAAPGVHILATSREPLRAEGEWVQRVQALASPPRGAPMPAREALAFPAIELFVERASAAMDGFVLIDPDVPALIDICHRLDGIPLAIELAAARIDGLGIGGIASGVGEGFALLTKHRHTAPPRHQSLRATMDWSYALLSVREQTVLQRLAVLEGSFSPPIACAVGGGDDLSPAEVLEAVTDLVSRSLVTAEVCGGSVVFRMLETTRRYAALHLE